VRDIFSLGRDGWAALTQICHYDLNSKLDNNHEFLNEEVWLKDWSATCSTHCKYNLKEN
jgi:hypothetical protein